MAAEVAASMCTAPGRCKSSAHVAVVGMMAAYYQKRAVSAVMVGATMRNNKCYSRNVASADKNDLDRDPGPCRDHPQAAKEPDHPDGMAADWRYRELCWMARAR